MDTSQSASEISFLRQLDIFDPDTFSHPCHVIGVGATGSRIAEGLARSGVPLIEVYDYDKVEPHNIPTGAFKPEQCGMPKVSALRESLAGFWKTRIETHEAKVEGGTKLSGIVFLCVDTMSSRREIWQNSVRLNPAVHAMIETRLGAQEGRVYTVVPSDLRHIKAWEDVSAYSDQESQPPPCTNRAVISTVSMIAGIAVQQMILWHRNTISPTDYANSIIFGLNGTPFMAGDRWL